MANISSDTFPEDPDLEQLFHQKHSVFYILLSVEVLAGFLLNSLFLLSFIKAKECTSNMYIITQSLSIVDILASLNASVQCIFLLIPKAEIQAELCRYYLLFSFSLLLCNSMHLLVMCADRFVAIQWPHR